MIVDAGLRDRRGEDQFAELFPLLNLDQRVELRFDRIRAEVDSPRGWARLVVSASRGPGAIARGGGLAQRLDPLVPEPAEIEDVQIETEYAVFPGEPWVRITTTIRNQGSRPAPIFAYGDVLIRGGRSMRSWVANTLAPELSRGFEHASFDRKNIFGSSAAMASFTLLSVPGVAQFPPIAYALFSPERTAQGLPSYGVTDDQVTFVNAFLSDPDVAGAGPAAHPRRAARRARPGRGLELPAPPARRRPRRRRLDHRPDLPGARRRRRLERHRRARRAAGGARRDRGAQPRRLPGDAARDRDAGSGRGTLPRHARAGRLHAAAPVRAATRSPSRGDGRAPAP